MNALLSLATLITSVSGSKVSGAPGGTPPIPPPSGDVNWIPWTVLLIVLVSVTLIVELGYWANRHRGQLPRARDGRLLYTIRFDGGPAGVASLRMMSDSEPLLRSLKADCPGAFSILLAADVIGQATFQSEQILGAIEHILSTLCSSASAPALYTQLRTVRDLMRRHPYARFQRIIDTPHPASARVPTAHFARLQKCQGVIVHRP